MSLQEFWRNQIENKAEEMGGRRVAVCELISLMGTDQSVSFYEDYVIEYGHYDGATDGADEFDEHSLDILSQWDDGPPCPRCGKSGRLEVVRSLREYRTFRGIGPDGDLLYDEEIINEQHQTVHHVYCGHCGAEMDEDEVRND